MSKRFKYTTVPGSRFINKMFLQALFLYQYCGCLVVICRYALTALNNLYKVEHRKEAQCHFKLLSFYFLRSVNTRHTRAQEKHFGGHTPRKG